VRLRNNINNSLMDLSADVFEVVKCIWLSHTISYIPEASFTSALRSAGLLFFGCGQAFLLLPKVLQNN
jgi:hypothetical protein